MGGQTLAVQGMPPSGLNLSSFWPAPGFSIVHRTFVILSFSMPEF